MLKFIKKTYFLIPLMVISVSCFELEQEVLDGITPEQLANSNNPQLINVLKASAYQRIVGSWGGHNSIWSLHEVASDELAIPQKGADWEDGGQWIRVHRHQYLPTEESVNNAWVYCYTAIGDINLLLLQFPDLAELQAELKVLRAMVYLWLIDAYGNVPIITEQTTDPTPPTNTRQEVFNFIESSVKDNMALLIEANTRTTVNKWVAHAILAKLYINAEVYTGTAKWAEAEAEADAIIAGGVFSLNSNFFGNFSTTNDNSPENIFTLNYDENNAGGFNLAQMTLHYESQKTFDLQEQPWNGYASLEAFYNSFDDDDARKRSFIVGPQFASDGVTPLIDNAAEANDPDGPAVNFTPSISMLAPNALRQEGARVGKFEFARGAGPNLSNDFPIFRYGDILLIKAEAALRRGQSGVALGLVNEIRDRAGASPLATLTLDELLAERGREMYAEGYRRSDLIRFGRYNEAWWEKPASAPTKNIFPIPFQQLQVNPNLQQNPGY